jgi:hypothetical protein
MTTRITEKTRALIELPMMLFLRISDSDGAMTAREMETFDRLLGNPYWCSSSLLKRSIGATGQERDALWRRYVNGDLRVDSGTVAAALDTVLSGVSNEERETIETDLLEFCGQLLQSADKEAGWFRRDEDARSAFQALDDLVRRPSARASAAGRGPSGYDPAGPDPVAKAVLLAAAESDAFRRGGKLPLRCVRIVHETHDVRTFDFETEPPKLFCYKPGQFITLELSIGGATVRCSYTIASTPSRTASALHHRQARRKRPGVELDARQHEGRRQHFRRRSERQVQLHRRRGRPLSLPVGQERRDTCHVDGAMALRHRAVGGYSFRAFRPFARGPHLRTGTAPDGAAPCRLRLRIRLQPGGREKLERPIGAFLTRSALRDRAGFQATRHLPLRTGGLYDGCARTSGNHGLRYGAFRSGELWRRAETRCAVGGAGRRHARQDRIQRDPEDRGVHERRLCPRHRAGEWSRCGLLLSRGSVGVCKVAVIEGEVEHDCMDGLSKDDIDLGYILACQAKPKGVLVVDMRSLFQRTVWSDSREPEADVPKDREGSRRDAKRTSHSVSRADLRARPGRRRPVALQLLAEFAHCRLCSS